MDDDRLRSIEGRANTGEYHCREHFAQFDADDDVLFLLAIIARLRGEARRAVAESGTQGPAKTTAAASAPKESDFASRGQASPQVVSHDLGASAPVRSTDSSASAETETLPNREK